MKLMKEEANKKISYCSYKGLTHTTIPLACTECPLISYCSYKGLTLKIIINQY